MTHDRREPPVASTNSFDAHGTLEVGEQSYEIYRLAAVEGSETLPYSLKVLLENLLRTEDGANITADHIRAIGGWDENAEPDTEIQFTPARVIMQDFTGVPCVVDLATMREAVAELGGDAGQDQPARPGRAGHRPLGDHRRLRPRRRLRAQRRDRVPAQRRALPVPALGPDRVRRLQGRPARAPASSTRSTSSTSPAPSWSATASPTPTPASAPTRTRRWSTASACSAGASAASRPRRPCSASPSRCSSRASSASSSPARSPPGATATDVVLTITEMLREHGVVGKFVEFYGEGVSAVPLANRATIGNMSPEFGSTCAIFPIDDVTLEYLRLTGRSDGVRRARRGLRQGAGHVAAGRPRPARGPLLRVPRARPVDRRAVDRRPEAPAGPHRR